MPDDITSNLSLPLPHRDNTLAHDVERLRDALSDLDTVLPLKADLVSGKVPSAQLPSFVDDVLEYANAAAFPGVGETSKIYVALDTGKTHRWSGSAYVEISASPGSTDVVPEGSVNLYFTNQRARDALQPATGVTLGGVKVGSGLSIDGAGVLAVAGGGGGSGLPVFNEVVLTPSTNGQTVFTPAGGYVAGQILLFLNGVLLVGNGDDYTASDGVNITLTAGANTTDTLLLQRWISVPEAQAVNKSGDTMTGALNERAPLDVASGATVSIATQNANVLNITGTTGITSFGAGTAGVKRKLIFAAALTITHKGTSLILPGAANITTAAGDWCEAISLGSSNWRVLSYHRASGAPIALPNPTMTGAIDQAGSVRQPVTAMAALDVDCSLGNYFTKTISGASTFTFSNAPASRAYAFTLELTHTSGAVTWPTSVKWPGDSAPSLTTGKTHLFTFVTDDGGTRWRGAASINYTN